MIKIKALLYIINVFNYYCEKYNYIIKGVRIVNNLIKELKKKKKFLARVRDFYFTSFRRT